jgi:ubiquinone/menaquinone biosynthesis C-methylase UbiE
VSCAPNAQYNLAAPGSLADRTAAKARRRMYQMFIRHSGIEHEHTLLDVGVTSDRGYEASNYVEAWYPHKDKITAVGIDDASFLVDLYPGLRFCRADGKDLPFCDRQFDFVHSSAVLEHVGSASAQRRFIEELVRVARRGVFLTTPNRWFPVEFHTVLPFVHWLPKRIFRTLLRAIGKDFFALENNLNLLDRAELHTLCGALGDCIIEIDSISLLAWPSNLILVVRKLQQR